jgi:hypothetical protein
LTNGWAGGRSGLGSTGRGMTVASGGAAVVAGGATVGAAVEGTAAGFEVPFVDAADFVDDAVTDPSLAGVAVNTSISSLAGSAALIVDSSSGAPMIA